MPPEAPPSSIGRYLLYLLLAAAAVAALYFAVVLNWSYSSGERAGWVQKFSKKGWLCKTWEGEIALVSMPGAIPEKFHFTVTSDEVAAQINQKMGRRVSLHYEQKVGLPGSCFGETRHYVTSVSSVEEMQGGPGTAPPSLRAVPPPGTPGVVPPLGAPAAPAAPAGLPPAPLPAPKP
jgi:hypothetical protein